MAAVTCLVLMCVLYTIQGMNLFREGMDFNNKDTPALDNVVIHPGANIVSNEMGFNVSACFNSSIPPVNVSVQTISCTDNNCTLVTMQRGSSNFSLTLPQILTPQIPRLQISVGGTTVVPVTQTSG